MKASERPIACELPVDDEGNVIYPLTFLDKLILALTVVSLIGLAAGFISLLVGINLSYLTHSKQPDQGTKQTEKASEYIQRQRTD
jgi:hypothetical protein